MLGRIKVLVAVVAAMTMLMMVAAPAMADDWNWKDRHDNDRHDYFIDYYEDFYDDFECEFLGYYDGEAIFACELD